MASDASLAVAIASLLGQRDDAARYLRFVRSITAERRLVPTGPLVDIRGDTVPDERVQPGVTGWAGSTPVGVGNVAKDQVQYDGLGLLVEAVSVYVQTGGRLDEQPGGGSRSWRTPSRSRRPVSRSRRTASGNSGILRC